MTFTPGCSSTNLNDLYNGFNKKESDVGLGKCSSSSSGIAYTITEKKSPLFRKKCIKIGEHPGIKLNHGCCSGILIPQKASSTIDRIKQFFAQKNKDWVCAPDGAMCVNDRYRNSRHKYGTKK